MKVLCEKRVRVSVKTELPPGVNLEEMVRIALVMGDGGFNIQIGNGPPGEEFYLFEGPVSLVRVKAKYRQFR